MGEWVLLYTNSAAWAWIFKAQQAKIDLRLSWGSVNGSYCSNIEQVGLMGNEWEEACSWPIAFSRLCCEKQTRTRQWRGGQPKVRLRSKHLRLCSSVRTPTQNYERSLKFSLGTCAALYTVSTLSVIYSQQYVLCTFTPAQTSCKVFAGYLCSIVHCQYTFSHLFSTTCTLYLYSSSDILQWQNYIRVDTRGRILGRNWGKSLKGLHPTIGTATKRSITQRLCYLT
jgi:hypothetical protein